MKVQKEVWVDSGQMAVVPAFGKYQRGYAENGRAVLHATRGAWYTAFVEHSDEGSWGRRVKRLIVLRGKPGDDLGLAPDDCTTVGAFECPSDALIVSDPCYIFEDKYGAGGPYDRACNATFDRKTDCSTALQSALFEANDGAHGVCASSGFGDGCYQMDATLDPAGELVMVTVTFISDEEEDEDCEEEEDESDSE